jgi:hypothetical protein
LKTLDQSQHPLRKNQSEHLRQSAQRLKQVGAAPFVLFMLEAHRPLRGLCHEALQAFVPSDWRDARRAGLFSSLCAVIAHPAALDTFIAELQQ